MIGLSLRDVAFLGSLGLKEYFYLGGDFRYIYDEFSSETAFIPIPEILNNSGSAGFDPYVAASSVYSDDRILIGGSFTTYNGTTSNRIARIYENGSLDTSFVTGSGFNSFVYTTAIQSDGKAIVGGNFTSYDTTTSNRISRLHTNGSLDTSFDTTTGANSSVYTTAIQSDGNIIIGGIFTSYNGTTRNRIARLHTNGDLDTSFDVGTGANNTLNAIAIQSDGKIIIGGSFTSYNGTTTNRIARLHTNGDLDTSFVVGTGFNSGVVEYIKLIESEGNLLVVGNFLSYNSTSSRYIVRIYSNGSFDDSFTGRQTELSSGRGYSVEVLTNGNIVFLGGLSQHLGEKVRNVVVLKSNGSVDSSINLGNGLSSTALTSSMLSNGNIFIGGSFDNFNYYDQNNVTVAKFTKSYFTPGIVSIKKEGSIRSIFSSQDYFFGKGEVKSISEHKNKNVMISGDNLYILNENKFKSICFFTKNGSISSPYMNVSGSVNKILSVDDAL